MKKLLFPFIRVTYIMIVLMMITSTQEVFSGDKNVKTSYDYEIYTPPPKPEPRINGPLVYGCRAGHPFLYRIPCQGERPIRFSVTGLPAGLTLDPGYRNYFGYKSYKW